MLVGLDLVAQNVQIERVAVRKSKRYFQKSNAENLRFEIPGVLIFDKSCSKDL